MTSPGPLAAALCRTAALIATAAALLATTVPDCRLSGSDTFTAETTCGPAGAIALSFSEEDFGDSGRCWAFLHAPGANAIGLPEQGEISAYDDGSFDEGDFALVGPAQVAGATPPRSVERICRFSPAGPGVLEVTCTGETPEAACGGTLTRLAPTGAGT